MAIRFENGVWVTGQANLFGEMNEYDQPWPMAFVMVNGKVEERDEIGRGAGIRVPYGTVTANPDQLRSPEFMANARTPTPGECAILGEWPSDEEIEMFRTPSANDGDRGLKSEKLYLECVQTNKHALMLNDQVRHGVVHREDLTDLLPTPRAGAIHSTTGGSHTSETLTSAVKKLEMMPTPCAQDFKRRVPNSQQQGLPEYIHNQQRFPTPQAMDASLTDCPQRRDAKGLHARRLSECVHDESMFPTPSASPCGITPERLVDKDGNPPTHIDQRLYDKETGRLAQKGLEQAVQLFPTPRAALNADRATKPTPSEIEGTHGWSLKAAIMDAQSENPHKQWPTPRVSMANGASESEVDAGDPKHRLESAHCIPSDASPMPVGSLNAEWVEWLMGFPRGYTKLDAPFKHSTVKVTPTIGVGRNPHKYKLDMEWTGDDGDTYDLHRRMNTVDEIFAVIEEYALGDELDSIKVTHGKRIIVDWGAEVAERPKPLPKVAGVAPLESDA